MFALAHTVHNPDGELHTWQANVLIRYQTTASLLCQAPLAENPKHHKHLFGIYLLLVHKRLDSVPRARKQSEGKFFFVRYIFRALQKAEIMQVKLVTWLF